MPVTALNGMVAQNNIPLPPGSSFTYVPGFATEGRGSGYGAAARCSASFGRTC